MNNFSRSALGLALTSLCVTSALAATKKPEPKPAAPQTAAPAAGPASAEIELVHTLGADKGAQLQKLVDRYNAKTTGPKIVIQDRPWSAGTLPHLMILGERDQQAFLSGPMRYRPVHQVMKDAGIKMETLRAPAMMTPTPLDAANRLNALPVGLATPVMFYNKQAFKEAGLDTENAPPTWQALQGALGKLVAAGQSCPYTTAQPAWVLVENTSAWHNEPVVVESKKSTALAINGMLEVKHVAMLSSWVKARYLHLFGRDDEAVEHFAKGECAVLTAASSEWPSLKRQAGFEVGVAPLPYHEEYYGAPQNTLADGPAMWVGAGKKAADYKAVAQFIDYWLTAESQVEWQRNAGYLPLNRAGLLASRSELLGHDLENVQVAVDQLASKPATPQSSAQPVVDREKVRRILDEELAGVWADQKAAKEALDNAVTRARNGN